jgi:hypothetical protein
VFGDAYIEVVWAGSRPVAMFNQDSPTTTPIADVHGAITGYVQVTDYGAGLSSRRTRSSTPPLTSPGLV